MLAKGQARIHKQLDVIEIMRKQIIFDVLFKIKLTKLERYFLRRNHRFALQPGPKREDSDSTFNSAPSDEEKVGKALSRAARKKDRFIAELAREVLEPGSKANLTSILKQDAENNDLEESSRPLSMPGRVQIHP